MWKISTLCKGLLCQEESGKQQKFNRGKWGKRGRDHHDVAFEGITFDNDMVWHLDIGAKNHMCAEKHIFVDI